MNGRQVDRAIGRWEDAALIDSETADRLRAEHAGSSGRVQRRFSQYTVAVTAGVLLVVAAVTFLAWSWPRMDVDGRSILIWAMGIGVLALGLRMERRGSGAPVSYALQMSGLCMLLGAYAYSASAWPPGTGGGIAVGVLSLATPIAALLTFARRTPVMLASVLAAGYAFAAVFLHRALSLSDETMVWALDGILVACMVGLALRLRAAASAGDSVTDADAGATRAPAAATPLDAAPGSHRHALNAFVVSVYAGFVFVLLTATVALDMDEETFLAFDAWLVLVTALALWGIHRAPPPLASPRYVHHVALSVAMAIPLGFGTTLEVYDAPAPVAALTVAGAGAAGLWYGLRRRATSLIVTACAAIVSAAWYLGAEYGDRLGAVVALGAVAVGFFWVAGRVGGPDD